LRQYRGRASAQTLESCDGSYALIFTSFAMAHMNASSSRAIAVVTTLACLPRAMSRL